MTSIEQQLQDCTDEMFVLMEKKTGLQNKVWLSDALLKLQKEYGEQMFEDVSLEILDFDQADADDTPPDYENKLSSEDIKFYEKHYPKRAGKYGAVGVTVRRREHNSVTIPTNPWKFNGYSWLTKSRVFKAFATKSQAIGYAKGVWDKYPTEEYNKQSKY